MCPVPTPHQGACSSHPEGNRGYEEARPPEQTLKEAERFVATAGSRLWLNDVEAGTKRQLR